MPEVAAVYKKSSYQKAYDWLATIAEYNGGRVKAGTGSVAAEFHNLLDGTRNGERYWLERREVE